MLTFSLFATICISLINGKRDSRQEEFRRIQTYELLHVDLTSFDAESTIRFAAFGIDYTIELSANNDLVMSRIRHANVDPSSHDVEPYITSATGSCHYFARVFVDDKLIGTGAVSLCDRQGVRGRIEAATEDGTGGDTLIIYPSAYYLDSARDRQCNHSAHDEHLVYRLSDFDSAELGRHGGVYTGQHSSIEQQLRQSVDDQLALDEDGDVDDEDDEKRGGRRRRLVFNGGTSQTELLIVNGPIRTQDYQSRYGSNWYQQMVSDYSNIINAVSAEYGKGAWQNSVGRVTVNFVELEVIFSFTGNYASLHPNFLYSNCQTLGSCQIDGNAWLSTFKAWIAQYKNTGTFDNAQLVSDMEFRSGYAGWGYVGTVCRGSSSVSVAYEGWGNTYLVRTTAHELGHNFGMEHDAQGQNACGDNDGIMGYGSGQGWSSCSVGYITSYFASAQGLTCLGSGVRSFSSSYGDDSGGNAAATTTTTRTPVTTSTTRSSSNNDADWDCISLAGFASDYNGFYNYASTYSGKRVYVLNNAVYIYWHASYQYWLVSNQVGSTYAYAYCSAADLTSCDGQFSTYASTSWVRNANGRVGNCGDSLPCQQYACVGITGMRQPYVGGAVTVDGDWMAQGCHNGYGYYQKESDASKFLCFSDAYSVWVVTDALCDGTYYAYSPTQATDVLDTSHNWQVSRDNNNVQRWVPDTQVFVTDCGGNGGAFSEEEESDVSCLEDNAYGEHLCVYSENNASLWHGHRTFSVYTSTCKQKQPIYHLTVSGDGDDAVDVFGNWVQNVQEVYYLHYHEERLFVDSDVIVGQWLLSKDELSVNALATCFEHDLRECTAGQWQVQESVFDSDANATNANATEIDGVIQSVFDRYMTLDTVICEGDEIGDDEDEDAVAATFAEMLPILIPVVCGVVALICVVCGIACWYCKCRKTQRVKQQFDQIQDPEPEVSMDGNENGTNTITVHYEMELEASLQNDAETSIIATDI
eukprot:CAMPEP_0202704198 /NCGR_PEP_ID=MMETSP1385-20130828/16918_1 /ASSEMBLY_ACC=CAM_ASM_000861 /TAXON_ID=933848 /ORGANISM="Elphidium margaritaceum" /LENGTH=978 /DNA_ID=CAMNT_0049362169 /DNA_START=43 /DNA_END=2979 /DNA_ORIENTATION=-